MTQPAASDGSPGAHQLREQAQPRYQGRPHRSSAGSGGKAVFAALAANLAIAVTKFLAFLVTGSSSMLAESVHSVADSGNQILLLVGRRAGNRPATPQHPFGTSRARYVYSFLVAIVLFAVGGLFSLYEAWEKWLDPEPITGFWWWVPLVVLAVAFALEGWSLRTASGETGVRPGPRAWLRFVRRTKSPELPVVLLEDSAALLGLLIAAIGVGGTLLAGDGRWDAAGSAGIGILLVVVAVVLGREMSSLLVGESASVEDRRAIDHSLVGHGVDRVIHMRTVHLGPDEILLAAKIAVPEALTALDVAQVIDAAEARVRAAVPSARWIYLEPDIDRAGVADI